MEKDYPHVGRNTYPQNPLTVDVVDAVTDPCLGVTLRQTATHDENGEKLQYNPIKKDELYAVLPGETVPVLSRGMVTLTDSAIVGDPAPGHRLVPHSAGRASGSAAGVDGSAGTTIGTVLASGFREMTLKLLDILETIHLRVKTLMVTLVSCLASIT